MKRSLLFILLTCILLALAACSEDGGSPDTEQNKFDINKVTFSKAQVTLSEAESSIGSGFGLVKDMETAEINGVTYAFEPKISMADREACIQTTEAVLTRIGNRQKLQINIYTTGTYDDTFIDAGSVFTRRQDWKSAEYIATLLYGLFGEYCNYGAVYGYANYLGNQLFDLPLTVCEPDWKFEGDPDSLDLNLLCFRPAFFTGKEIKVLSKIANTFVVDYMEANGEADFQKLLVNSGSEKADAFTNALADFYAAQNIDYTPTNILYRYGGRTYDYIVKCEYAVMYIEKDWTDANMDLCPLTYEGFLHQNYADTRDYFSTNIAEMGKYQALFDLDAYDNDLDIHFTNHYDRNESHYIQTHSMSITNTASFATCYIRSLIVQTSYLQENWVAGFIHYFSYKYNHYGNAMLNYEANMPSDSKALLYVREFRENIGRDVDIAVDYPQILHIAAYTRSTSDPNSSSVAGASFTAYLISRFGEEKVIETVLKTQDFGEHTYEELVNDWKVFIEENYSGYTKYKP